MLCIDRSKPTVWSVDCGRGKARAIEDRGKQAEKVAGDCGSHKRVWDGAKTALTAAGDSQTVCDGARQSSRPAEHQQMTPRQSATVPRPSSATVPDSLSDRRGTCRRLPDNRRGTCKRLLDSLRRCQDHLGTYRRPRDSLRRCRKVYQTGDAPAGDSQTVCNDIMTVWAPGGDSQTVCDGARQSFKPAGHLQETPRQCATEIPRQSAKLPENLPDRQATRRRLLDNGARRESQTVCYGAKTVWSPAGYSKTVCDGANTVSALAGDLQKSLTVPDSL
ncbi:hypothetical protein DPMN_066978 [Dreissena polymorpha]|uniref:Uncharacterized protein n=1 Tax=Dreissena polymorpha TaxID=45954 RepID=A0A9D4BVG9_DREPO|nr:hypothetical protein DPMN_066978 [Dreissena polymorpha]